MKTTNTTTNDRLAAILALLSEDEAAELASMAAAQTSAPKAPKAPKASKAPKAAKAKAPKLNGGEWVTFTDMDGTPQMCKAKATAAGVYLKSTHISDAQNITKHANQGKALQALNELRKAPAKAEAKPTPKAEEQKAEATADLDERAARIAKRNAAIIATAPAANRRIVENKLAQAHKAGYPYARLARNKHHQLDGLHLYPGEKGHGRDAAFKGLVTKAGAKYRDKADQAREAGNPAPKPPAHTWYWSPVGGGNLYIRGIFGEVTEA